MVVAGLARSNVPAVLVSALTGEGCEDLLAEIATTLDRDRRAIDIDLAPSDGAALAWLYDHGSVLHREDGPDAIRLRVRLDEADIQRFAHRQSADPAAAAK